VQVSRYDKWKDPLGVIEACQLVQKQCACRLVLAGNNASDDPEGQQIYDDVCRCTNDRISALSVDDSLLVNALQRRADIVVQKSIREGFGLTVAEAMWKGTPVIGGNVGGFRHQIINGENGFLVDSIDEAAERIVHLLRDPPLKPQEVEMRKSFAFASVCLLIGIVSAFALTNAVARPVPKITASNATSGLVAETGLQRYYRSQEYIAPRERAVRPTNCGEFHYWDGMRCVDARYTERHLK
jgi:glycosyltransferase involved in cell wall biosynthesis